MEASRRACLRLVGLKRVSACCGARVAHSHPMGGEGWNVLVCADCHELVDADEVMLENCLGEVVWPVGDEEIAAIERMPRLKRSRRKPTEAEPPSYRLILPRKRG